MRDEQPGLEHFAELIEAARQKRAPDPAAVAAIADAARHLFTSGKTRDRLERFGDELGMFRQQGKSREPDFTVRAFRSRIGAVGYVIQREHAARNAGATEKAARASAKASVCAETGVNPRTLSRWLKELRADVEMLLHGDTDELPWHRVRWGRGHDEST